jgi:hypothetical protein
MKLRYLAVISAASLLNLSALPFVGVSAGIAQTMNAPLTVALTGNFVSAQSATEGTFQIVTENGQQYLELDESFITADAPDLFVLLHKSAVPDSYAPDEFINLGELQQLSGTQRYAIPDGVDVSDYESAVIWCREFDVTMGYASLEGNTPAPDPRTAADPCAADPCAADPCAADPCAADPCAADPCAADPCAADPCAADPCAADPCAADPCAADPCAADPCAGH